MRSRYIFVLCDSHEAQRYRGVFVFVMREVKVVFAFAHEKLTS